ncbi:MAG: hypothetical protein WCJ64_23855 [Rhodospirillaceae bacterium]
MASIDAAKLSFDKNKIDDRLQFHLQRQVEISQKIGFKSVVILVDRVDETHLTGADASSSFQLIRQLLSDLPTLELPGIGFKFFLWDKIIGDYETSGARPDRVKIFKLNWKVDELQAMLRERLRAFSNNKYTCFTEIVQYPSVNVHRLVARLCAGSPRDMIRICGRIVDEHTRTRDDPGKIEMSSVYAGIRAFCGERCLELYGVHSEQIRRLKKVTFTVNQLANDVLRVTQQAARNRIGPWQNAGAIRKIDEIENKGNRPLHLYGIVDPRLVIDAFSAHDVELLIGNYIYTCPSCSNLIMSDRAELICECGERTTISEAKSLYADCV